MNNFNDFSIMDAFLALKDIDDDQVEGMLRAERKARQAHIHEGKSYSIHRGSDEIEAAKKFLEESSDADEIEVIDVDADSVDHLKKNTEYIGQGILSCNRCKANRFIDMELLTASEADEDVYNIDDECPHCHDSGNGYSLIGQVGKIQKEEEAPEAAADAGDETNVEDTAEATNDEASSDDATFDNDLESDAEEEPAAEETKADEVSDFDTFEDEPESDGMETNTSEDELDDLELPDLGDEVDRDDVKADEDEDVKESLNEDVKLNALAEDAWMMNRVISSMNNEEAYYGGWLYIWPDGETREECAYDFGEQEEYDELRDTFLSTYEYYHNDGLFDADSDVVAYAHNIDKQLGLAPIENLKNGKPVNEGYGTAKCEVVGDLLNMIAAPENIDKIIVIDMSDEKTSRDIFTGKHEDLPLNVVGSPCKSFDVQDGYLTCNIDTDDDIKATQLGKVLEMFGDDDTENILLWDEASGNEVFSGTKADAVKQFGTSSFISFETPAVIKVTIANPAIASVGSSNDEMPETDLEKLVKDVVKANNMSVHKIDKPTTNEYWINDAIMTGEDVELIYESFVKPTENKALIKEFKRLTGYRSAIEEAYEEGYTAAKHNNHARRSRVKHESVTLDQVKSEVNSLNAADKKAATTGNDKGTKEPKEKSGVTKVSKSEPKATSDPKNDQEQKKQECLNENTDGRKFRVGDVLHCTQLYGGSYDLVVKKVAEDHIVADEVWTAEDTGKVQRSSTKYEIVKDSLGNDCIITWEYKGHKGYAYPPERSNAVSESASIVSEVKSCKTRKELAEAINDCKNNSRPYSVRRSVIEGYRYDLVFTEAVNDAMLNNHAIEDLESALEYGEITQTELDAAKHITFRIGKSNEDVTLFVQAYPYELSDVDSVSYAAESGKYDGAYEVTLQDGSKLLLGWYDFESENKLYDMSINEDIDVDFTEVEPSNGLVPADAAEIEIVDDEHQSTLVEYSPELRKIMDEIHRVALDTAAAIGQHYGIDADPALIVADIIRDLRLVSGDISVDELTDSLPDAATKAMFNSYEAFYDAVDCMISDTTGVEFRTTRPEKLRQAVAALHGPAFSTQNINRAIGSRAFIAAARSGQVPYITANDIPLLEDVTDDIAFDESLESDRCEQCGKVQCECVNAEQLEELDLDIETFDAELNEYFNESYDDTVIYTSTDGHVNMNGVITLEGMIQRNDVLKPVKFTLTPKQKLSESLHKDKLLEAINASTFRVTNNMSEEVFEFEFKK